MEPGEKILASSHLNSEETETERLEVDEGQRDQ